MKKFLLIIFIFNKSFSMFDDVTKFIEADSATISKNEKSKEFIKKIWKNKLKDKYNKELESVVSRGFQSIQAGQVITPSTTINLENSLGNTLSPNGNALINTNKKGEAVIWDLNKAKSKIIFKGQIPNFMKFSTDGQFTISTYLQDTVIILDIKNNKQIQLKPDDDRYKAIIACISPNNRHAAVGCLDGQILVWDLKNLRFKEICTHKNKIHNIGITSDNKILITCCDFFILIWDLINLKLIIKIDLQDADKTIAFSQDYSYCAIGYVNNNNIRLVNIAKILNKQNENVIMDLQGHVGGIRHLYFSHNNKYLLSSSYDGTARIWNTLVDYSTIVKNHTGNMLEVRFSPDDKFAITSSENEVYLLELSTLRQTRLKRNNRVLALAQYMGNSCYALTDTENQTKLLDLNNWVIDDLSVEQIILILKLEILNNPEFLKDPYFKLIFNSMNPDLKSYIENHFIRKLLKVYTDLPIDLRNIIYDFTGPDLGPEPDKFVSDDIVEVNL